MEEYAFKVSDVLADRIGQWTQKQGWKLDTNGLAFKTILHSGVYYAPIDLALVGSAVALTDRHQRKINPGHKFKDADVALKSFANKEGLEAGAMTVRKKRGLWVVDL